MNGDVTLVSADFHAIDGKIEFHFEIIVGFRLFYADNEQKTSLVAYN